jgi:hypothetical protein
LKILATLLGENERLIAFLVGVERRADDQPHRAGVLGLRLE